jgi:tetratricopeptide (TPR) repeat protein
MSDKPMIGVMVFVPLLVLAGCEPRAAVTRDAVLADYRAGRYRPALRGAELLARRDHGRARDEARYIAGVSAYRLGMDDKAIDYLLPVTGSGDRRLAGQAAATVGLIYSDQRRDAQATRFLRQAVDTLDGEDLAQVHYHLGLIEQRAGHWSQARTQLGTALSYTSDATLRRAIRQRRTTDSFAIQFGAYTKPELATKRAAQITALVHRARIGRVRVAPSITETGRQLYLVQAGSFKTNAAAVAGLRRLGHEEAMIVPAAR